MQTKKISCAAATAQDKKEANKLQDDSITFIPNCKDTYEVFPDHFYPVIGVAKHAGTEIPIVDVPMTSDYKWQLNCLKSRLIHPEQYEEIDGNVTEVIGRLLEWLRVHAAQATARELKELYEIVHLLK